MLSGLLARWVNRAAAGRRELIRTTSREAAPQDGLELPGPLRPNGAMAATPSAPHGATRWLPSGRRRGQELGRRRLDGAQLVGRRQDGQEIGRLLRRGLAGRGVRYVAQVVDVDHEYQKEGKGHGQDGQPDHGGFEADG